MIKPFKYPVNLQRFVFLFSLSVVLLGGCRLVKPKEVQPHQQGFDVFEVKAIGNNRGIHQTWKTDTSKHTILFSELRVLLRRNAISPLNDPRYLSNRQAKSLLSGSQPAIVVEVEGQQVGVPLNMLSYHEIVNDSIGNTLFSVAYCPLCNTAMVLNRKLNFHNKIYVLKFGTSGMLRMSNLVMWDEQTETWWQHLTAQGLVGELAGAKLEILPAKVISLNNFWTFYPNGKTMFPDEDSDQLAKYALNPYVKYDSLGIKQPFLFFGTVDPRLPAMEYVIGYSNGTVHRVYPLSLIKVKKVVNDQVGNKELVLFYNADMRSNLDTREIKDGKQMGSATVFNAMLDGRKLTFVADHENFRDQQTESTWNFVGECIDGDLKGKSLQPETYTLDFAFAYFAFYPDASLYSSSQ